MLRRNTELPSPKFGEKAHGIKDFGYNRENAGAVLVTPSGRPTPAKEASVSQAYQPPEPKRRKEYVLFTCPQCGGSEWLRPSRARGRKFCSHACYSVAAKGRPHADAQGKQTVHCETCGVAIDRWPSAIRRSKHIFCSKKCEGASRSVAGKAERYAAYMKRYLRLYAQRNREKHNARGREWARKNRDKRNANQRVRRSQGGGLGTWGRLRLDVFELHGERCLRCGSTERIEIDHVVPVALGGVNKIENLQPLCRTCNASKSDKVIDYREVQ